MIFSSNSGPLSHLQRMEIILQVVPRPRPSFNSFNWFNSFPSITTGKEYDMKKLAHNSPFKANTKTPMTRMSENSAPANKGHTGVDTRTSLRTTADRNAPTLDELKPDARPTGTQSSCSLFLPKSILRKETASGRPQKSVRIDLRCQCAKCKQNRNSKHLEQLVNGNQVAVNQSPSKTNATGSCGILARTDSDEIGGADNFRRVISAEQAKKEKRARKINSSVYTVTIWLLDNQKFIRRRLDCLHD
uniref:Uncharacterized protein n=1 Tax=Caenorhabditis tropicalis TaxID=1561998 RepID=A0A1I7TI31_9PELO